MPPPCKFINTPGGCRRSDCPFDHDQSMNGSSNQRCKFYQQGNCRSGASCRFQHVNAEIDQSGFGQSGINASSGFGFGRSSSNFGQSNPFQTQSQQSNAFGGFGQTNTSSASNPFGAGFGQTSGIGSYGSFGSGFGSSNSQFTSVFGQQQSAPNTNRFNVLQSGTGLPSNPFQISSSNPFASSSSASNTFDSGSTSTNPFVSASTSNNAFSTSPVLNSSFSTTASPFASQTSQPMSSTSSANPFMSSTAPSNPFASTTAQVSNPFTSASTQSPFASNPLVPTTKVTNPFATTSTGTGLNNVASNGFQANTGLFHQSSAFHTSASQPSPPMMAEQNSMTHQPSPMTTNLPVNSSFSAFNQETRTEPGQQQNGFVFNVTSKQPDSASGPVQTASQPGHNSLQSSPAPNTSARSVYSEEMNLTDSDKAEYAADTFSRIPFLPPARTMV